MYFYQLNIHKFWYIINIINNIIDKYVILKGKNCIKYGWWRDNSFNDYIRRKNDVSLQKAITYVDLIKKTRKSWERSGSCEPFQINVEKSIGYCCRINWYNWRRYVIPWSSIFNHGNCLWCLFSCWILIHFRSYSWFFNFILFDLLLFVILIKIKLFIHP